MTLRDKVEAWIFAAIIIVGVPALLFASRQIPG